MDEALDPIEMFVRYSPDFTPSCFQQDLILQTVTDPQRWRRTLEFWFGNSYRPQSIQKMLCYYEELGNGTNKRVGKRSDADTIRESADFYDNYPA